MEQRSISRIPPAHTQMLYFSVTCCTWPVSGWVYCQKEATKTRHPIKTEAKSKNSQQAAITSRHCC